MQIRIRVQVQLHLLPSRCTYRSRFHLLLEPFSQGPFCWCAQAPNLWKSEALASFIAKDIAAPSTSKLSDRALGTRCQTLRFTAQTPGSCDGQLILLAGVTETWYFANCHSVLR